MAQLPVPRSQLTAERIEIPVPVRELIATLHDSGHAAYVVGGSVRDALLGRVAADWDLATDARPDRLLEVFPGSVYENKFGTVAVRLAGEEFEITTFRSDHDYADFRRPHRVEFGDTIEVDLARRDFTINAMAWGGVPGERLRLIDPYGGRGDAAARIVRAVGDPDRRFSEDALRMIRAIRLAAAIGLSIEPATLAAIRRHAPLVAHLSGERIATELTTLLEAPRPSIGLRLLADTGLLAHISPELDAQRGVPQNKIPGEDLWDHTLRTVDAAREDRPIVRLAALLHDIGKPSAAADGRFIGHDAVGAVLAADLLRRLHSPRETVERVSSLVRQHMFAYEPSWSDAAVRRFLAKIGERKLDELFELREADNVGSGLEPSAGGLDELRRRVADQVAIGREDLAIDGDDLIAELGLEPGPRIGRILAALLDRVIVDPVLNDRPTLLVLAQAMVEDEDW